MSATIEDLDGHRVAIFDEREDALLCLPALARILRRPLRMHFSEWGNMPLPRGVVQGSRGNKETLVAAP